jgi:hypothetical protein
LPCLWRAETMEHFKEETKIMWSFYWLTCSNQK